MIETVTQPTTPVQQPRTAPVDWEARRKRFAERDAKWLEKRRLTCEPYAEASTIVAHRGPMLAAWSMMRDVTGEEIQRHLATLAQPYVERVVVAAWDLDSEGNPRRNWTHWAARAIAVVAWFLACHCRADSLHGRTVWKVTGFSMRFFAMLCSQHVWRGDKEERITPGRSTFGNVSRRRDGPPSPPRGWMGALVRVGLLEAHQFDADKVRPNEKGKRRWNPRTKQWEQWAMNQWFLVVCPFEAHETRPKALGRKRKNQLVVRRVTDSLLHRQRRNAIRRAEQAEAEERARLDRELAETYPHIVASPQESTGVPVSPQESPSSAPSRFLDALNPATLARLARLSSKPPD